MFNATTTSPYSAILTWEPPAFDQQNGVITGYIISVSVLETNETFLLYSNTTYLIVTSLKPFRTYVCIIAAQTGVGTGPFGTQFVLNTPEDGMKYLFDCLLHFIDFNFLVAPSAPPVPSLTPSVTSTRFSITWNPPGFNDQNGVITYYTIIIIEIESGDILQYTSYTTSLSVISLHPAYTYEYKIAAYTVGLGPFSTPINITTAEEG